MPHLNTSAPVTGTTPPAAALRVPIHAGEASLVGASLAPRPHLVVSIPGEPFAQPRPRARIASGRGRQFVQVYEPNEARTWKAGAQQHMAAAVRAAGLRFPVFATGPVELVVLAVFTCPTSHHRKTSPRPRRLHAQRPDADNVIKAVKDAATGVLWLDDAQVAAETCTKVIGAQGEAPGVLLTLRGLGEVDVPQPGWLHQPAVQVSMPLFEVIA